MREKNLSMASKYEQSRYVSIYGKRDGYHSGGFHDLLYQCQDTGSKRRTPVLILSRHLALQGLLLLRILDHLSPRNHQALPRPYFIHMSFRNILLVRELPKIL